MLGYLSFTEVTDPTAHAAYNEWHQLDHLPEQFSIEGIQFGQRWVCSPRCVDARLAVSPLLARCQYMTLYLLRDADALREFMELAQQLRQSGRFFDARQAHLSGSFDVIGRWAAERVQVSAAAVPFRPAHVYVVVSGVSVDLGALQEVPGVAGVWQFAERSPNEDRPDGTGRHIAVAFVDGDLWQVSSQLAARLGGQPGLEWAGPLERVDPFHWGWFG